MAPFFQAMTGGLIAGAASIVTVYMGHRADTRKRADEFEEALTKAECERKVALRDRREAELREAVRSLRVSHFRGVTAANDYTNALLDAEPDQEVGIDASADRDAEERRLEELYKASYLTAREEAENLRAVSRASEVRNAVDDLIEKMRDLHDFTEDPPNGQACIINELSREVSDLVRKVSEVVDSEIQKL